MLCNTDLRITRYKKEERLHDRLRAHIILEALFLGDEADAGVEPLGEDVQHQQQQVGGVAVPVLTALTLRVLLRLQGGVRGARSLTSEPRSSTTKEAP